MEREGERWRFTLHTEVHTYTQVYARVCIDIKRHGSRRRVEQETGQLADGLEIFSKGGREERVKVRFECWF